MNPILFFPFTDNTINLPITSSTSFDFQLRFIGTIRVEWGDGTNTSFTSTSFASDVPFTKTYGSSFTGTVKIKGNINTVNYISSISSATVNWTEITKCKNASYLFLASNTFSGNMTGVTTMLFLSTLYLSSNNYTGVMTNVSLLTQLAKLYIIGNGLTGDLSGVSLLLLLQELHIAGSGMSGNLTGATSLTALVYLVFNGINLTGNMSGVSARTSLATLVLNSNNFTGNMGVISSCTLLTNLQLNSTAFTYTYATLTANFTVFSLRLQTGQLSSPTVVDQLFIDCNAVATTKTGTFIIRSVGAASPTSTSLTARNALVTKGRLILTN